jgi:tetratricopeptide (TPR) repeat protein
MLLTRKANLLELSADLSQARPLWAAALALQKSLQPPAGLDAVYWQEAVSTHLGLVKCLQFENRLAEALELLRSAEARLIFEHAETHDPDFLIAELLGDLGEHAQALAHLQLLQAQYASQPSSRIEETFMLVLQADCYFKLGQLEQALELYEAAFAEEQYPSLLRAESGRLPGKQWTMGAPGSGFGNGGSGCTRSRPGKCFVRACFGAGG